MQLGKTLVGAIIGAALGIALLVAVFLFLQIDQMWLAIPVAILTGLGVRMMVSTHGHASYLRGALTVILALGAYLGGLQVAKAVAMNRASSAAKANPPRVEVDESTDADAAKEEGEAAPAPKVEAPKAPPKAIDDAMRRPAIPGQFSPWDAISLAIAAFIAYELGRGSGMAPKTEMAPPSEPMPGGTHPDA
jgi:hypothetical protein